MLSDIFRTGAVLAEVIHYEKKIRTHTPERSFDSAIDADRAFDKPEEG